MGGVATAELASAVALAGALGMIGGVRLGANVLGEELDSLPRQTRSRIKLNGCFWMERIRYSVFLKLDFEIANSINDDPVSSLFSGR